MSRFREENFSNIVDRFSAQTNVRLYPKRYYRPTLPRKTVIMAVVAVLFVALAAFAYPIFSPLNGDALSLEAIYEGNGNVTVYVENRSNRNLEFQPQLKLVKWITGEEVPQMSENISYDNLEFPAHSMGTLKLNLSQAYDMQMLEDSLIAEWYYLELTNYNFVFGQKWKCSVYFGTEDPYQDDTAEQMYSIDPAVISRVEEDLQFYFEDDFTGFLAANPLHYDYLQKAQELLLRHNIKVVEATDASLIIPLVEEERLFEGETPRISTGQNTTVQDAFGKLIGSTAYEHVTYISAFLPEKEENDGSLYMVPLLYFSFFETASVSTDACTFIHGQIVDFDELEPYKVYEDSEYICFNVTHLFYTDLDTYMEDIVKYRRATQQDYYYDEGLALQLKTVYDYYTENTNMMTWDEFLVLRGMCKTREFPESEELAYKGVSGQIVSDFDILKVTFTITSADKKIQHAVTFVPKTTDSPWGAYGCELSEATQINEILETLEAGEYTFGLDVLLDTDYHPKRDLCECIFTVGE